MKTLESVREQLVTGAFEFSRHAFRRAVERNISEQEIREAGMHAEIIENYPEDKYSPVGCCLASPLLDALCTSKYRLRKQS